MDMFVLQRSRTSLAVFCKDTRSARRGKGTGSITDNRIKALDELGFDWGDKKA